MVATRLHKASAPPEPQPSEADDPKIKKALKKLRIEAHATLVGEKPQEKDQNIQTYRWKNGVTYAVDASTKPEWIEESENRRKRLSSESRVFSRTTTPLNNSITPQNDSVGETGVSGRLRRTSQTATPSALRKRKYDSEEGEDDDDEADESSPHANDTRASSKRVKINADSQPQQVSSNRAAERASAARTSLQQRKRARATDEGEDEEENDGPPRAYRPRKKLRTVGPGAQQRSSQAARATTSPLEPSGPSNDAHRSTSHNDAPHQNNTEPPLEEPTAKSRSSPKPTHSISHPTNIQPGSKSQPVTSQPSGLTRKRIMEDMRYIHQQEIAAKSKGLQVSALPESDILSEEQRKDRRKAARNTVCDGVMQLANWDRDFKKLRTEYYRTKTDAIRLDQKRRLEKRRFRQAGKETAKTVDSRSHIKDLVTNDGITSSSVKSMLPTPPTADVVAKTGCDAKTSDRTARGNSLEQGAKLSPNTKPVEEESGEIGKIHDQDEAPSAPRRDSGTAGDEDLEDSQRCAADGSNKAKRLENTGLNEEANECPTAEPQNTAHSPESVAGTPQNRSAKQPESGPAGTSHQHRAAPTSSKTTPPDSDTAVSKNKKFPDSGKNKTPAPRSMVSRLEDEDRAEFSVRRARASLNPQSATPRHDRIRHDMDIINSWPLEKKTQAKTKEDDSSGDAAAADAR